MGLGLGCHPGGFHLLAVSVSMAPLLHTNVCIFMSGCVHVCVSLSLVLVTVTR